MPVSLGCNRLAIGNFRGLGLDFQIESACHLLEHHPQVQVADTGYYRFVGLVVAVGDEGGIFFCQAREGFGNFSFIASTFRRYRQ